MKVPVWAEPIVTLALVVLVVGGLRLVARAQATAEVRARFTWLRERHHGRHPPTTMTIRELVETLEGADHEQ